MQFYCYLPKTVNYIWSLMWNLFCRLSVNKLCGSLQAAYLTVSVHFPHTGSATLTRAASCRYSQAKKKRNKKGQDLSVWGNNRLLHHSHNSPLDISGQSKGCWRGTALLWHRVWTSYAPSSLPYCVNQCQTKNTVCSSTIQGVKDRALHMGPYVFC